MEGSKKDGRVTEAMDVFSAGCVLAELFLEGTPLFTLSQLFKYLQSDFDLETQLSPIIEESVRVRGLSNLSARSVFDDHFSSTGAHKENGGH